MIDSGHGGGNPRIGRHLAIFDGDVEIGANEYAFTFEIEIGDFNDRHGKLQICEQRTAWTGVPAPLSGRG
jgi:hypothetical protein